jgi:hypothetical protein
MRWDGDRAGGAPLGNGAEWPGAGPHRAGPEVRWGDAQVEEDRNVKYERRDGRIINEKRAIGESEGRMTMKKDDWRR